jgi:protein-tyrosine-phosphatase/DNA-binding transcriptional ArsR family regulator
MYCLACVPELRQPSSPPTFLQLAGHPVRWGILTTLARSDSRVRELTRALHEPQSLISYHLGRLRAEGAVATRRSSADRRDSYYRLDLERCAELLGSASAGLHPALQLAPPSPPESMAGVDAPPRVLFLCTGNSARSQLAEALLEDLGGGCVQVFSAGSRPKPVHPDAVRVMRERGLDIAGRHSKHVSHFTADEFDWVVSLCDRLREVCPEFPGHPQFVHWSVPDPAAESRSGETTYDAFERTAVELETRIRFFLHVIFHRRSRTEVD